MLINFVFVNVCERVLLWVCLFVCVCLCACRSIYICMYVWRSLSEYLSVCIYVCICGFSYVCVYTHIYDKWWWDQTETGAVWLLRHLEWHCVRLNVNISIVCAVWYMCICMGGLLCAKTCGLKFCVFQSFWTKKNNF